MVPAGCALFPQICEVDVAGLARSDPAAFAQLQERFAGNEEKMPKKLYFNKGL